MGCVALGSCFSWNVETSEGPDLDSPPNIDSREIAEEYEPCARYCNFIGYSVWGTRLSAVGTTGTVCGHFLDVPLPSRYHRDDFQQIVWDCAGRAGRCAAFLLSVTINPKWASECGQGVILYSLASRETWCLPACPQPMIRIRVTSSQPVAATRISLLVPAIFIFSSFPLTMLLMTHPYNTHTLSQFWNYSFWDTLWSDIIPSLHPSCRPHRRRRKIRHGLLGKALLYGT